MLQTGRALDEIPDDFHIIVGAMDRSSSDWLLQHLQSRGIIDIGTDTATTRPDPKGSGNIVVRNLRNLRLTLIGWDQYETARRGDFRADYGFIAMQFDDPTLDSLVEDAIKPIIQSEMGYRLVDMRDVARAGIIDNIMRMTIRDAAFVIADLTHGNQGAYWEAGYAEGLDKPVVYICEKDAFEDVGTHFDTNHCTTVPWTTDDQDGFCKELVATLRRSLDLES
jgi:nucleoside 2-deoxyribosyltransferase